MIDTCIQSSDEVAITAFCSQFVNYIGPQKGLEATAEYVDEFGATVPAQDAICDPTKWYACIRTHNEISLPPEIQLCDCEYCRPLIGVWSSGNVSEL